MQAWADSYKFCFRSVKFDIFPRFRSKDICEELLILHLRRCLPAPNFRDAFCGAASPVAFSELQVCVCCS